MMTRRGLAILFVLILVTGYLVYYFTKDKTQRQYYDDGRLWKEYFGKEDTVDGLMIEYNRSGGLKSRVMFKDGKQNGRSLFYYDSGELQTEAHFTNGIQDDTLKVFYKNGKLHVSCLVKNAEKDGFYREFNDSGKLTFEGLMRRNLREGFWRAYDTKEPMMSVLRYERDTLVAYADYIRNKIVFTNKVKKYTITFSENWKYKADTIGVAIFDLVDNPKAVESISIYSREKTRNTSKSQFDQELAAVMKVMSGVNIIERKTLIVNGSTVRLVEYSASPNNVKVHVAFAFIEGISSDKIIICLAKDRNYKMYFSEFMNTIESFRSE
jgi:MORN repeat variant